MIPRALVTALFALTTFTSAFLLFQVQPLLSKRLLPWFGGSPAVWTTCVLFFQSLLFAGYAYAHASEHWLPRRVQMALHIVLLAAAFFLLPILPGDDWKPAGDSEPIVGILTILGASVGLAYFLLSSTGPLVSAWFSRVFPARSPYRLYALSNFGSLLALVTYPFLFEPAFSIAEQADYWAWGYRLFALMAAASAVTVLALGRTASAASAAKLAMPSCRRSFRSSTGRACWWSRIWRDPYPQCPGTCWRARPPVPGRPRPS